MSQRVAKMESLIQQVVATTIRDLLQHDAAWVTVTRVDAAPDLRQATVWLGLLGTEAQQTVLIDRLQGARSLIMRALAGKLTTKFAPQLHLRADGGGAYAAEIDRLLKNL